LVGSGFLSQSVWLHASTECVGPFAPGNQTNILIAVDGRPV
jgi:hypothetical protein